MKKKDEGWKTQNISEFLKGEALKVFINYCLECTTYDGTVQILKEKFILIRVPSFFEFASLKLNDLNDLKESYLTKKIEVDRQHQL